MAFHVKAEEQFLVKHNAALASHNERQAPPYHIQTLLRVCLKNSLIRNFGVFSAISASSILDLALLSLRIYSLN